MRRAKNAAIRTGLLIAGWLAMMVTPSDMVEATATSTPTSFGPLSKKVIAYDGKTMYHVGGIVHNHTTYMPVWYIIQLLKRMGVNNHWTGLQWDVVQNGLPTQIGFVPVYPGQRAIVFNGAITAEVPSFVYQKTTYMPIWYVMNVLRKLGLQTHWNGTTWSTWGTVGSTTSSDKTNSTPAGNVTGNSKVDSSTDIQNSAAPSHPILYGFAVDYDGQTEALSDIESHVQSIQMLSTFTHDLNADGTVAGVVPESFVAWAKSHQIRIQVSIINQDSNGFNGPMAGRVLSSATLSARLVNSITSLAQQNGYSGVNIDFEELPRTDGPAFNHFLTNLHEKLNARGIRLSVDVPAETSGSESYNAAYDYASIGKAVDDVIVMAYDYSYPGSPAGPIAPIPWVTRVLTYATQEMPAGNILLGVPAYGYDWVKGKTKALKLTAIDTMLQKLKITPKWDAVNDAPYFTYKNAQGSHTVYYEDARSLTSALTLAQQYHVKGVAMWRLGLEDDGFWPALQTYEHESVSPLP